MITTAVELSLSLIGFAFDVTEVLLDISLPGILSVTDLSVYKECKKFTVALRARIAAVTAVNSHFFHPEFAACYDLGLIDVVVAKQVDRAQVHIRALCRKAVYILIGVFRKRIHAVSLPFFDDSQRKRAFCNIIHLLCRELIFLLPVVSEIKPDIHIPIPVVPADHHIGNGISLVFRVQCINPDTEFYIVGTDTADIGCGDGKGDDGIVDVRAVRIIAKDSACTGNFSLRGEIFRKIVALIHHGGLCRRHYDVDGSRVCGQCVRIFPARFRNFNAVHRHAFDFVEFLRRQGKLHRFASHIVVLNARDLYPFARSGSCIERYVALEEEVDDLLCIH